MKRYSFQRKIIWVNISIITGIIMLLFLIAFFYLVEISNRNFEQQLQVHTAGFAGHIDGTVQVADEISLQLAANNYIIEEFQKIQNTEEASEEENYFITHAAAEARVKKFMTSYTLKKSSIGRVCLFDEYENFTFIGNAVDYGYLEKTNLDGHFMEDILDFFDETGRARMVKLYEQDPFYSEQEYLMTVTREIKDYVLVPSEGIGFVQVQIPAKNFRNYFVSLEFDGEAYIINEQTGAVIFQYNGSESGVKQAEEVWQRGALTEEMVRAGKGVYLKAKELEDMGLTIVMLEQNHDVTRYVITTLCWFLLLLICMLVLVTAGQIQVVRRTTKPIIELCELVEGLDVDEDMLELPMLASEESDELRNLNYAFNGLVKNLRLSLDHRMMSQINELRAHMFALQSQMNPHFIHNILSIISAMASRMEYQKIPAVCEQLSAMIRYTTTFNDSYIPMEEEVAHTVNYLELMKLRYEERFQYTISCVGAHTDCPIPKFIIQPLIENCFLHGFRNQEFPWKVELLICAGGQNWEAEICDNGKGITSQQKTEIFRELEAVRTKEMAELVGELGIGGLSLKNVYARLFIAYGEEMVFQIEERETAGCVIRIGGLTHDKSHGSGR